MHFPFLLINSMFSKYFLHDARRWACLLASWKRVERVEIHYEEIVDTHPFPQKNF